MEKYCNTEPPHRLTQHKRFVPYGTYPCLRAGTHRQANFCFAKTSFMLKTLGVIGGDGLEGENNNKEEVKI